MSTDKYLYLYQYENGYRYNSDSLLLYDFISKFNPKGKLLDVGSGSGILGLLVKRDFPCVELAQIDVQEAHYKLTCKSAAYNNLESEVLCGDFLEYKFQNQFDCIVSNPPFYRSGSQKSVDEALRISRYADVLPFEKLAARVSKLLNFRGSFIFCYDARQIDILLCELLKYNLKPHDIRFVHAKEEKESTLVLIHAKKGSKSVCKILPPLYGNTSVDRLSPEVKEIYAKTKTKALVWED